ncbi:MAG: PorT family protein [Fibrobacter sp.]|nr:PorT family protein [Fibrobacter sp.]
MRKIFVMVIILAVHFLSYSQDRFYGIKGGLSISNFWGAGSENVNNEFRDELADLDEKNLSWFAVSMFSSREIISDLVAVQTEINYIRQGKEWESDNKSFQIYADYLYMPWLLKLELPVMLRPGIYIGPHLSLMFAARVKDVADELQGSEFFSGKDPSGELFERFVNVVDAGLTAGLDFDIELGPGVVILDFRYVLGVLNTFNFQPADKTRNYSFLFMAGYALNFGY